MITREQFQRIPVVREVLSDLDTPLSVYLKLADAPHTYLFESVEGGERFGRYSIIGLPVRRVYTFRGHTLEVRDHGELIERREVADPFAEVEALRAQHVVPKLAGVPGFTGGLVGWFGFECIGYIPCASPAPVPRARSQVRLDGPIAGTRPRGKPEGTRREAAATPTCCAPLSLPAPSAARRRSARWKSRAGADQAQL
ncbi:hypothetical protein NB693_22990 [Pantoea ananatis]|uniref:hypothetical protein n=1 Tax=Pantoea ananas TaxID=553 RepID=UPI00221FA5D8|nr:hypothetical protein [Pantoea ananatis]